MNHPYLTSLGNPYLAFVAEGMGDLSNLPSFGLVQVNLQFRIEKLPVQKASATEIHPLFAFAHDFATQPTIFECGVTPLGVVKAAVRSGSTWDSGGSITLDADRWHTADFAYDGGSGQWFVRIDDAATDTSVVDPGPEFLLPNAGYGTKIMLFNGKDGLARTRASVRRLFLGFIGAGGTTTMDYDFHDDYGNEVEPEFGGTAPDAIPGDGVMRAQFYNPLISLPWGALPEGSPADAYRWGLATDYTRLPKPVTKYTRVPA